MDSRVINTKKCLGAALIEILKKKSIYDITIRELCSKANINRTTFYKHYNNQFDLLTEMETKFLEDITAKFSISNCERRTFLNLFIDIFNCIKKHKEFAKLLAINLVDKDFENKLIRIPFSAYYPYFRDDKIDPVFADISYEYIIAGCSAVIRKWLRQDCAMPVETLAKYIIQLVDIRKK